MPAKSRKQQKYLYHKFGPEWVKKHHFNTVGVRPKKRRTKARKSRY